ncbi:hypothetical protein HAX54_036691 [Datura stramonium]|uniref:Uncharacterized protein n=1 Tax=Datura stramonium TaxID=4076 RepID=A0ABS8VL86_DATST|nr:hypothetical protein [Datura stramonium]
MKIENVICQEDVSLMKKGLNIEGKYDVNEVFRYITVDYLFKTRIEEIYNKYAQQYGDICVAKEEDVICDYIKGYRLVANVSCSTVDAVMVPFNCRDKHHRILDVVHFRYKCIRIYDSYRSYDPLEVREYDVYVVAYAKYLSNRVDIRDVDFQANLHQFRYSALLWDYDSRKIEGSATSDDEVSAKLNRTLNETISQPDSVIE